MYTFSNWIAMPENRSALEAARHVAVTLGTGLAQPVITPLFLHGPSGSGKTHLAAALAAEVALSRPGLTVASLSGRGLGEALKAGAEASADQATDRDAARNGDLLVVEDVQHFPARAAAALDRLLDHRHVRSRPTVLTSISGPAQLGHLPSRLTSRFAAGLVVGLGLYGPASRRLLLQELARRRRLPLGDEILDWLANWLEGSGRQVEGALTRLETLARVTAGRLDLATVVAQFAAESEPAKPTLERIADHVCRAFQVKLTPVKSAQRGRRFLVPRQVTMFLARRLTGLSLSEIGTWFGGRDHTTVLHACRKIEAALESDTALAGQVRALEAELTGRAVVRQAG